MRQADGAGTEPSALTPDAFRPALEAAVQHAMSALDADVAAAISALIAEARERGTTLWGICADIVEAGDARILLVDECR